MLGLGWVFRNAVADAQEQAADPGRTDWQHTPTTAASVDDNCEDCRRARAALFVDLGYYPGIPPRRDNCQWATDPTVYGG